MYRRLTAINRMSANETLLSMMHLSASNDDGETQCVPGGRAELIAGEGCRMERFAARFVRISRSPHCHQPVYRSEPSPRSPLMPPRAPTSLESLPSSWAPWLSRGSSPQKSRKVLWPPATTQRCALALWALPQGSMHCVLAHWQRNSRSGLSIRSQRGLTVLGS